VPTESAREIRELKCTCAELERTIEVLEGGDKFLRAGVRPAAPLICEFITQHRCEFGVASICRALSFLGVPIAARPYFAHMGKAPSKCALWDMSMTEILAGYYTSDARGRRPPESL
jgi:hypothetical protein